jgi:hypothetical protein
MLKSGVFDFSFQDWYYNCEQSVDESGIKRHAVLMVLTTIEIFNSFLAE